MGRSGRHFVVNHTLLRYPLSTTALIASSVANQRTTLAIERQLIYTKYVYIPHILSGFYARVHTSSQMKASPSASVEKKLFPEKQQERIAPSCEFCLRRKENG